MSGYSEEKITNLLSFPYDTFLMLRCEFIQIVGNDLEAKVLRILEKTVQAERNRLARDSWTRSEKAKKAVKQLLADGRTVTPEKLSAVYRHMATMKPNPKTGFTWADKMSVTHVCENYDSIWLELVQAKQQRSLHDTTRDKPPLRTRVIYGSTEPERPFQPLPVVALLRNTPRRWLIEKGM